MRRVLVLGVIGVLVVACGIKYVKFPAGPFLIQYWQIRLQVQDDTYTGRMRCRGNRENFAPGKQAKCLELDTEMAAWHDRDMLVLNAVLTGGAVDQETLAKILQYAGKAAKIALDIAV